MVIGQGGSREEDSKGVKKREMVRAKNTTGKKKMREEEANGVSKSMIGSQ